jgi:hypothetical protein
LSSCAEYDDAVYRHAKPGSANETSTFLL